MGKTERLEMKAVKEAARKAARGAVEEMLRSSEFKKYLSEALGLSSKNRGSKTNAPEGAREARGELSDADIARIEREIREGLLEAGVRRQDLDWALMRFQSVIADLPPDKLKEYELQHFVDELRSSAPHVFRDHGEGNEPKTAATAAPPAKTSTGARTEAPPASPEGQPTFDALKATPEQVRERLEQIRALRGQSAPTS